MSDQLKFMSSAKKKPPIPMVGVKPNPRVVASKFALVSISSIFFDDVLSGIHTPALIAVDVLDCAKIPYTLRNGNSQKSGLILKPFVFVCALSNLINSSRLYFGPLLNQPGGY